MLNVKTALFLLAFIPQFVDSALPALGQFLLLGSICVALNTAVDVAVVLGASRIMRAPGTALRRARMMSVASGSTLIGLGVYIAIAKSDR